MPRNVIEIMGQIPDMQNSLAENLVRAQEDSTKFLQESLEKTKSKQEIMLDIQNRTQREKSQALQIHKDAIRAERDSAKRGKELHKAVLKNIGQLAVQAAKDKIAEKTDPVTSKIRYARKAGIKGMTKDALLALEPAALKGLRNLYAKHRGGNDDDDTDEMTALPSPSQSSSNAKSSVASTAMSLLPQESSGAKVVGFGSNKGGAMPSGGDSTGAAVAKELSDSSTQEVAIISQFMKKMDDQFVIQNEYNRKLLELIEDIKDEADDGGGGGAFGIIGDVVGAALTAGLGAWGYKLWNKIRGKSPEDAAKAVGDAEKKVTDDIKKGRHPPSETVENRGRRGGRAATRRSVPDPAGISTADNIYRRGRSTETMRSPAQVREDRARSLFDRRMGDLDARERAFSSSIERQHSQALQSIADTQNTATKALSRTGVDTRAVLQGHADDLGTKLTDTGRMAREGIDTHVDAGQRGLTDRARMLGDKLTDIGRMAREGIDAGSDAAQRGLSDKARMLGQEIDIHVDTGRRGLASHTQTLQQGLDTHTSTAQRALSDKTRMLGNELTDIGRVAREGIDTRLNTVWRALSDNAQVLRSELTDSARILGSELSNNAQVLRSELTDSARILGSELGNKLTDIGRIAREGIDTHVDAGQRGLTDRARMLGDKLTDIGRVAREGIDTARMLGSELGNTARMLGSELTDTARILGSELGNKLINIGRIAREGIDAGSDAARQSLMSQRMQATESLARQQMRAADALAGQQRGIKELAVTVQDGLDTQSRTLANKLNMQAQTLADSTDAARQAISSRQMQAAQDISTRSAHALDLITARQNIATSAIDTARQSSIDNIRIVAGDAADHIAAQRTPVAETSRSPAPKQPGRRFAPSTPGASHSAGRSPVSRPSAGARGARGRPFTTSSGGLDNLAARVTATVNTAADAVRQSGIGRTVAAVADNAAVQAGAKVAAKTAGVALRAASGPIGVAAEVILFLYSGRDVKVYGIGQGFTVALNDLHDNLNENIHTKGRPQEFYTKQSKNMQDVFDDLVEKYTQRYRENGYGKDQIDQWIGREKSKVDMASTRPGYWKQLTEAFIGGLPTESLMQIAKAHGSPLASFLEEYHRSTINNPLHKQQNWIDKISLSNLFGGSKDSTSRKEKFLRKLMLIKPVTVFDWLARKHVERTIMSETGKVEYQGPVTATGETIYVGGESTAILGRGTAVQSTKARSQTMTASPHAEMVAETAKSERQIEREVDMEYARFVHPELFAAQDAATQSVPSTDPSTQSAASAQMAEQPKKEESLKQRARRRYRERKLKEHQEIARKHKEAEKQKQLEAQIDAEYAAFIGIGGMTVEPEIMPMAGSSSSREPSLSDFDMSVGMPQTVTEMVQPMETQMTAAATRTQRDRQVDEIADKIAAKIAPRIAAASAPRASRRQGQGGGAQPDASAVPSNIPNLAMWKVLTEGTDPDYEELMEG